MIKTTLYLLALQSVLQITSGVSSGHLPTRLTIFDTTGRAYLMTKGLLGVPGPLLDSAGVVGRLVVAEADLFACDTEITTFVMRLETMMMAADGVRPIVIIERSPPGPEQCTFEDKVMAVQNAGAIGAIIFDYVEEGPILMGYEHDAINIPAIFVSKTSGEALLSVVSNGAEPIALLTAEVSPSQGLTSLLQFEFVSFSTGYLFLLLITLPVIAITTASIVRRQRELERVYAVLSENKQATKTLANLLPADLELPKSRHEVSWNSCICAQSFTVLVFAFYLFQMLFSLWHLPHLNLDANQSATFSNTLLYGSRIFFISVLMAAGTLSLRACLCAIWSCIATYTERIKHSPRRDMDTELSDSEVYVTLTDPFIQKIPMDTKKGVHI